MNLKAYLAKKDLTYKQFSMLVGLKDKSMIAKIIYGLARPSPDLALAIEKATSGAVNRLELLYPDEYEKRAVNNGK